MHEISKKAASCRLSGALACALVLVAPILGCEKPPSVDEAKPSASGSLPVLASNTASSSSAIPPPPAVAKPGKRCGVAGSSNTVFLGRLKNFRGNILGTDGLGLLTRGRSHPGKDQIRRLPFDFSSDTKFEQEPAHQVLVDHAREYHVTSTGIYYLTEVVDQHPSCGRVMYLPTGGDARLLINEANAILGEWDGWLYALRFRDLNRNSLGKDQVAALLHPSQAIGSDGSGSSSGFGWRYTYDLLRVRPDGKEQDLGQFPRSVDAYHQGYIYGRNYDPSSHELSVFRAPVTGGPRQTIYSRKRGWGRGGVEDHLGRLNVDNDGIFFYEADPGVVTKLDHEGKHPEVLVKGLAFHPFVEVKGDYIFVNDVPSLKQGAKITWKYDRDKTLEKNSYGFNGLDIQGRFESFQFTWGRREYNGVLALISYEYLPGGIVNVERLPTRDGYWWRDIGADQDCVYYTASDWANTWYYALGRPVRTGSK